jgi:hypothetical protein
MRRKIEIGFIVILIIFVFVLVGWNLYRHNIESKHKPATSIAPHFIEETQYWFY